MKYRRLSRLACLLLCGVALAGCQRSQPGGEGADSNAAVVANNLRFQALNIGRSVEPDGTVVPTTLFTPQNRIIASVLTKNAAKDAPMEVQLIAMANGRVVSKLSRSVSPEGDASTNFEFKKAGPWPLGRYVVEARLSGKLQASQPIEVVAELPPGAPPRK